jgi:hypothetical protein
LRILSRTCSLVIKRQLFRLTSPKLQSMPLSRRLSSTLHSGFSFFCVSLSTPHVKVQFDTAPSTHSLSPAMFLVHFDACRAVPDVSAMSDAYVIVQHGANTFIGGTSAACPVVAGLISLLNSERMAAGALVWTLLHVQNSSLKCWRE